MANYVPHHTKKKQILEWKERALVRLISNGAPADKLLAAAEDVRDGRVRVLRAQRATIAPEGAARIRFDRIDEQIRQILDTPLASILAEFGRPIDDDNDAPQ